MAKEVVFRSPTRVDLSGGTLDCWPLYLFLETPVTVNIGIDIFTQAGLTARDDQKVKLKTEDLKREKVYQNLAQALDDSEPGFGLVREHLKYWQEKIGDRGFELWTKSDSPVGGGLGGSSSLCISLLKVFQYWLISKDSPGVKGETFSESDLVRLASHIEAKMLLKPTGTQDYFPPIEGGLCYISYETEGPRCVRGEFDQDVFADRFILVYTGRSHHSGINNWQVIKDWLDNDLRTREALRELSEISKDLAQAFQEKSYEGLPEIFSREYHARTKLSSGFSSPEIKRLHQLGSQFRAETKICGAGGGGCVMIWSHDGKVREIQEACVKAGFQVLGSKPVSRDEKYRKPILVGSPL